MNEEELEIGIAKLRAEREQMIWTYIQIRDNVGKLVEMYANKEDFSARERLNQLSELDSLFTLFDTKFISKQGGGIINE